MSLLDQIQDDLINPSANLSDILRRARVLASKLNSPELRDWAKHELDGYERREDLPEYRKMTLPVVGNYFGPLGSGWKNVNIPTMSLPKDLKAWATTFELYDNVAATEEMLRVEEDSLRRKHEPELTTLIRYHIGEQPPMVLTETFLPLPKYILKGVIDNIKNRLLDLVLDLQEKAVNPDDPESTGSKSDVVRGAVTNHIYGNNNVVAIGENISQQVSTVQKGDIGSLLEFFKENNVPDSDLEELRKAIVDDPGAAEGKFGPRVSSWMGGMVSKAASGAWQIAMPVATAMLQKGIESYYGI